MKQFNLVGGLLQSIPLWFHVPFVKVGKFCLREVVCKSKLQWGRRPVALGLLKILEIFFHQMTLQSSQW